MYSFQLFVVMRTFSNLGSGINNLNIGTRPRNPALDQLVQTLKLTGYTEAAADDIANALGTLSNYGLLNLAGGNSLLGNLMNLNRLSLNSNSNSNSGSASNSGANQSSQQASASIPSLLGNPTSSNSRHNDTPNLTSYTSAGSSEEDSVSLIRQLTQTLSRSQNKGSGDMFGPVGSMKQDDSMSSLFSGGGGMFNMDNSGMGYQSGGSPEQQDTQEIEVAENLAGAVIGQQGRGISEIQQMTGASVSVSRRGVYAPGTNNRVVTITGPGSGVNRAAMLVRQRIQEAEQRRAQNAF